VPAIAAAEKMPPGIFPMAALRPAHSGQRPAARPLHKQKNSRPGRGQQHEPSAEHGAGSALNPSADSVPQVQIECGFNQEAKMDKTGKRPAIQGLGENSAK